MNKQQRTAAAKETLQIIDRGVYTAADGQEVNIKDAVQNALLQSRLYKPEEEVAWPQVRPKEETVVEVRLESTLQATQRLYEAGHHNLYCLNFASAKNPGGGFLGGAQAQEESLARSSALYPCLLKFEHVYEFNRNSKSMLYSDHMIYSPAVPVFRNDEGVLLGEAYPVSFISSPAVNMGALLRNTPYELPLVDGVFKGRLDKILRIAAFHGHETLVLGAWGCGVFANDVTKMAQLFKSLLGRNAPYSKMFKHVVYAINDTTVDHKLVTAFNNVLTPD